MPPRFFEFRWLRVFVFSLSGTRSLLVLMVLPSHTEFSMSVSIPNDGSSLTHVWCYVLVRSLDLGA